MTIIKKLNKLAHELKHMTAGFHIKNGAFTP